MILQVIWNNELKQTSLYVSGHDINNDYEVITSFPLKEQVSINFVQNFIAFEDFNISYLEDTYFWLDNISLTKNILAFFNAIDIITLKLEDLLLIDRFGFNHKISISDINNLGFQSPIKTIPRDLSTQPEFMNCFLNIGDVSYRLLRTNFEFHENKFHISINKRILTTEKFFNHLNSNRDRLRIKESLFSPLDNVENVINYFSQLQFYQDPVLDYQKTVLELPVVDNDLLTINAIETSQLSEEDTLHQAINPVSDNDLLSHTHDLSSLEQKLDDIHNDLEDIQVLKEDEQILKKENDISLNIFSFISHINLVHDKREDALENFQADENFHDFFATERNLEDFLSPSQHSYVEVYDHSVYEDNIIQEKNLEKTLDDIVIEEELTEDFLVEIESNIHKKTNDNIEEDLDVEDNEYVSVEDLVDSINDIIDESSTLELFDIIDLPIFLFLSNPVVEEVSAQTIISNIVITETILPETEKEQETINHDEFLDNIFIDSDVNSEINDFSAEEVLADVKREVSIFENMVIDKKKNKSSKNKHKKIETVAFLDRDFNDGFIENNEIASISTTPEHHNANSNSITISDNDTVFKESDNILLNNDIPHSLLVNSLLKTNTFNLNVNHFIHSVSLSHCFLIHSQENILIIEFLLSAILVDDTIENSDLLNEDSFNFAEENKKKLIDLSMNGDIESIEELYLNYPDFEKPLINFNYEGDNPLCIASFNENLDLLKKLISYGWNPNYFDSNLNNALIIASAEGHKHIVKFLLTQTLQLNFQNKKGYTALHFAVNDCNHRIVKLLIDAGADVDLSDNDRNTPLSIAAFKGDINSTKLLLQTRINIHTKNKKGYDARSIALLAKNHAVAKLIEDKIVSDKHHYSLPPIIEKSVS